MKKFYLVAALLTATLVTGCTNGNKETPQATLSPSPAETVLTFVVQAGVVMAPPNLTVQEGTSLVIRVTTDASDEVHLHGYDLTQAVTPAAPAELRFVAKTAGRFELELHGSGQPLGVLVVQPK